MGDDSNVISALPGSAKRSQNSGLGSPSRVFVALGLVFGLAFAALTPPLGSPDEQIHLARTFLISEGHFRVPGRAPGFEATFPRSLLTLHRTLRHAKPMTPPRRFSAAELRALFAQPLAAESRRPGTALGSYGPVAYLPQALLLLPGRLLEAPPVVLVYLGRLGNLLAWLAAGWLALRLLPLRGWATCLLLLTPMAVAQAASLSADVPTHAAALLVFACATRAAFGPESLARRGDLVGLTVSLGALGLTKPGYWLLAALVVLIPARRFRGRRERVVVYAATLLAALVPSALWLAGAEAANPLLSPNADPRGQLGFVLGHPLEFAGVLVATVERNFFGYVIGFVGVLGHLNVHLPTALHLLFPGALAALALADRGDPATLGPARRAALVVIFLLGALGILSLAYLGWCRVGQAVINGVQGRYFVPFVPLLLLALPARGGRLPPGLSAWGAAGVAAVSLSSAATALWNGFFVG